ncbi:MAG: AmmeMemoRadiSam system protein B [Lentisphaerae bacterium]|nr:AmmeMemoRadiSam system protein B [Lentisphaerota bacterium]
MMRLDLWRWGLVLVMAAAWGGWAGSSPGEELMQPKNQEIVRRTRGDGHWFPGDKTALSKMINEYLGAAPVKALKGRIIGAISPHAGYVYSGAVAGYVFRALQEQARQGDAPATVVILGFGHRGAFRGVALMDGDRIRSPLGETALDQEAAALLCNQRPLITLNYAPHNGEHSAENQIPFVQTVLPEARLVVGLIGDHDANTHNELVDGLVELAKTKKIVVIASSDMLHDPDYVLVTRTDKASLERVAGLKTKELLERWSYQNQIFCGMSAVAVMMRFAERQGVREGIVLRYRNTGDDYPDSRGSWVVGYGAVVFPLPVTEAK